MRVVRVKCDNLMIAALVQHRPRILMLLPVEDDLAVAETGKHVGGIHAFQPFSMILTARFELRMCKAVA